MPTVSTIPFPRYSRSYDHKFAHFGKGDTEIFKKFLLSDLSNIYIGFDYDIKVGEHAIDQINTPDPASRLKAGTLAKRVDAVAFRADDIVDLIEVKANKIHSAVGQILAYKQLFTTTYPDIRIYNLIILTAYDDPELIRFAQSLGILTFVLS